MARSSSKTFAKHATITNTRSSVQSSKLVKKKKIVFLKLVIYTVWQLLVSRVVFNSRLFHSVL